MKLSLLFILILVILILYYGYPFYRGIRISKDIQSKTTAYEQHPLNSDMRILIAGDSTGVGTGADYPLDSTSGQLGQKYPQADITNISVNGLKLDGLVSKLQKLEGQYDLILIQIGANDIVQFTNFNDIENKLRVVLELVDSHSNNIVILTAGNIGLSPVFKFPISNWLTYRTQKVRNIFIKNINDYPAIKYVDLYLNKDEDFFSKDTEKYYARDKFHPSSVAYSKWFDKIKEQI